MAGDRQQLTGASMSAETGKAEGGSTATVARPPTGQRAIADDGGGNARPPRPRGAPSGSITHPGREGGFEQLPEETLSKEADGTWRYTNEDTGQSWRWDEKASRWRGEGDAPDEHMTFAPPPEDMGYELSDRPNEPPPKC